MGNVKCEGTSCRGAGELHTSLLEDYKLYEEGYVITYLRCGWCNCFVIYYPNEGEGLNKRTIFASGTLNVFLHAEK